MSVEALFAKYKPMIIPQKVDSAILQNWLRKYIAVEPIPMSEFTNAYRKSVQFNLHNMMKRKGLSIPDSALEYSAYRLLDTEANREYNEMLTATHEKFVHVIFEEKTNYIDSNSAKLFTELDIVRGVSAYDYENNTLDLISYISRIDQYLKHEY